MRGLMRSMRAFQGTDSAVVYGHRTAGERQMHFAGGCNQTNVSR